MQVAYQALCRALASLVKDAIQFWQSVDIKERNTMEVAMNRKMSKSRKNMGDTELADIEKKMGPLRNGLNKVNVEIKNIEDELQLLLKKQRQLTNKQETLKKELEQLENRRKELKVRQRIAQRLYKEGLDQGIAFTAPKHELSAIEDKLIESEDLRLRKEQIRDEFRKFQEDLKNRGKKDLIDKKKQLEEDVKKLREQIHTVSSRYDKSEDNVAQLEKSLSDTQKELDLITNELKQVDLKE